MLKSQKAASPTSVNEEGKTNSDTTALSSSLALLNKKLAGIFVTPSKKET